MMRPPPVLRLGAWSLGAATLLGVSVTAAVGSGTGPPLGSAEAARAWLESADAAEIGAALVRGGVVLGAAYLFVITMLALVPRRGGGSRLTSVTDRVALPPIVRLARRSAGVGLTASVVVGAGPIDTGPPPTEPPPGNDPSDTPTMVLVDNPDSSAADDGSRSTATQRRLDPPEADPSPTPAPTTTTTTGEADSIDPTRTPGAESPISPTDESDESDETDDPDQATAPPSPGPSDHAVWTIEPGEHLWAVAAETLRDHGSTTPSHAATARYLATVIDANRDVLADPDNPDLVYPGQIFVLPPIAAPPVAGQPW